MKDYLCSVISNHSTQLSDAIRIQGQRYQDTLPTVDISPEEINKLAIIITDRVTSNKELMQEFSTEVEILKQDEADMEVKEDLTPI